MWPSTSCPLSSLTRNIVFGRASVISPSISIFSSLPMRVAAYLTAARTPPALATFEIRLAGALVEEGADRALQILGGEQPAGDGRGFLVGLVDAALEVGADDPLGRRVGFCRAGRQLLGEAHALLEQLVVSDDSIENAPALERCRVVEAAGHHELAGAAGPGSLGHPLGAAAARC